MEKIKTWRHSKYISMYFAVGEEFDIHKKYSAAFDRTH